MPTQQLTSELARLIADYAEDVAGGFSKVVYHVASGAIPPALALLLNPERLGSLGEHLLSPDKLVALLNERLRVEGSLEHLINPRRAVPVSPFGPPPTGVRLRAVSRRFTRAPRSSSQKARSMPERGRSSSTRAT